MEYILSPNIIKYQHLFLLLPLIISLAGNRQSIWDLLRTPETNPGHTHFTRKPSLHLSKHLGGTWHHSHHRDTWRSPSPTPPRTEQPTGASHSAQRPVGF